MTSCWLAQFSTKPCEGRLRRCHLIPKQLLKREGFADVIWDTRLWVWGCGGPTGIGGHHGQLDTSRALRIPRESLPEGLEIFAAEHDLLWFLEREYGPMEAVA